MTQMAVESCDNCGGVIGHLEEPKQWEGYQVCAACRDRLRVAQAAKRRKKILTGTAQLIGAVFWPLMFLVGAFAGVMIFVKGGQWVHEYIAQPVASAIGVETWVVLPLSLFLLIVRPWRGFGGIGLFFSSFAFGFGLWLYSLVILELLWGKLFMVIGLCLGGVGVVPLAIVATLFSREWGTAAEMVICGVIALVARWVGLWVAVKAELDE